MRDALRLRLELLPHLYNCAAAAHAHGMSLARPLYHEWPERDDAYNHVCGRGLEPRAVDPYHACYSHP